MIVLLKYPQRPGQAGAQHVADGFQGWLLPFTSTHNQCDQFYAKLRSEMQKTVLACTLAKNSTDSLKNSTDVSAPSARFSNYESTPVLAHRYARYVSVFWMLR